MWHRKNKNKKNKKEEDEKEERACRLCQSLTAKIQQLEYSLITLKKEKGTSHVSLIQKIQQTSARLDPHVQENKKIRLSIKVIKKEIEGVEQILKPFTDQKKKLVTEKKNKIESYQQKINSFKSNNETEEIIETLNKKNKKLKKYTCGTNALKSLRAKCQKEFQKMKQQDYDGSWMDFIPEEKLKKILFDQNEYARLIEEMRILDKRQKKMLYQNRLTTTTSNDYLKIEQRLQETKEKIEVGKRENLQMKREILEMKELLGDEALYSRMDGNSEDSQTSESEFTSVASSNDFSKGNNSKTDSPPKNSSSLTSIKKNRLSKAKFRSTTEIQILKEKEPTQKNRRLMKIHDSQSVPQIYENSENEQFTKKITHKRKKKKKKFTIDSLQMLLKIPIGVEYFREFLVSQLCQENIMFWLSVKALKQQDLTKNKIIKSSKKIFQTFILEESPFEINIQSSLREKLIKQYNNKNFFTSMFDKAHEAVLEHMIFNSWGSFQETKHFTNLLQKLTKDPNYKNFSNSTQRMKLRYNIQPYKALNEGNEYHDKILHPIVVVESLLEHLIQLLNIHYCFSKNFINLKNIHSTIPFQKFVKETAQLKYIKLDQLENETERLCFFLNVYNLLTLHSFLSNGLPHDQSSCTHLHKNSIYLIDGNYYSLNDIFHGILRANTFIKSNSNKASTYFKPKDEKSKYSLSKTEPMIHFAIIDPYRNSILKIYRSRNLLKSLKETTTDLLLPLVMIKNGEKMILPKNLLAYEKDFTNHGGLLNWMAKFVSINLMSLIIANQQIKYSTKILKNPQIIVDFEEYSIKKLFFNI
ncbi:electron carrier/ protein disulfide oxidoreductase [Anaeramoeba flamelloides]|uniref:Electron carrier/ protein disulfide oxidoreductase n=1 Tax=Anaeramoeba flamelloides TaxID=1746091 RepID=A0ABQ8Y0S1_9EUKA|nr:electron carrier/ protein disulfide oxidoreductase [Anaeramoeba flamelloides]